MTEEVISAKGMHKHTNIGVKFTPTIPQIEMIALRNGTPITMLTPVTTQEKDQKFSNSIREAVRTMVTY